MLISIAGSQGAGKTTILNELQRLGYNVIQRKTSRSILAEWGVTLQQVNSDSELTVKFQNEILRRKWDDEHANGAEMLRDWSNTVWFTERTYADLFTYNTVSLGKDNAYSDFIDQYWNDCRKAQEDYDHVFYLEGGKFQVQHDGVRGSNQFYARMVDLTMLDFTKQMTPLSKLSIITTPSLDERINQILTKTIGVHQITLKYMKE